jgi:type I restriction-modification system DNA methylase subunit
MRSQERKKSLGEVFTPAALVNDILDKLPKRVWSLENNFLDNSCGNGNFLIEVLRRKLELGHDAETALSTIYGVDIMPDNVAECQKRLGLLVKGKLSAKKAASILKKNIVCHDALTYDYEFN